MLYFLPPISIPYLGKITSSIIEKKISDTKITINKTTFSISKKLNINLKFISVIVNYQNRIKIKIPEIKLNLSILKLLTFNFKSAISDIFFTDKKIEISYLHDTKAPVKSNKIPLNTINDYLKKNFATLENQKFHLENLNFNLGFTEEKSLKFDIQELTIATEKKGKKINIILTSIINLGDKPANAKFIVDTFSSDSILIHGGLEGANLKGLSKPFSNTDFDFNLNLIAKIKYLNRIENLNFDLTEVNQGFFEDEKFLKNKVTLNSFALTGHCDVNCALLTINKISGTLNDNILITGEATFTNYQKLSSKFKVSGITVNDVYKNWPLDYIPKVKNWLNENLLSGKIETFRLNYDFNPSNPNDNFDINFNVNEAQLKYLNDIPKIYIKNSLLKINYKSLLITTNNALFSKNKITDLKGVIDDFYDEDVNLKISADLNGALSDQLNLIYAHIKRKNPFLNKVKGKANTTVNFEIPFKKKINLRNLNFKLKSELNNVFTKKIYGNYYITNASLNANVEDLQLQLYGSGNINDKLHSSISLTTPIEKEKYNITIGSISTANQLRDIGIKIPNFITKTLNIKTDLYINNDEKTYVFFIDLKKASVALNGIGINKEPNKNGNIQFRVKEKPNSITNTVNYSISLPDFKTAGYGIIDAKNKTITFLKSEYATLYDSHLEYSYDTTEKAKKLTISGVEANLEHSNILDLINSFSENNIQVNQEFILSTNINTLKLKNALDLKDIKFNFKKSKDQKRSAEFTGYFSDKEKFYIYYNTPVLAVVSNNAGKTLSAFYKHNYINSGDLELKGRFLDNGNFSGSIYMTNFYIKKAPTLAKILSMNLAAMTPKSLIGIKNLLDGKGIQFYTFDCPINYYHKENTLNFNDCIAKGPTLTIKVSGKINTDTKYLTATGAIIQSNIFNKVFSKLPLFGKLLSGGKDEGVIFTITYNISGYVDQDIKVKTNYLSYITPGFLRELFKRKID